MDKINLEETLRKNNVSIEFLRGMVLPDGHKGSQGDRIIESMKDAIRQALELSAEKAEANIVRELINPQKSASSIEFARVNKQSILSVINLIE